MSAEKVPFSAIVWTLLAYVLGFVLAGVLLVAMGWGVSHWLTYSPGTALIFTGLGIACAVLSLLARLLLGFLHAIGEALNYYRD